MAVVPVVNGFVRWIRSIVTIAVMICACALNTAAVAAETVPRGDVIQVGHDLDSNAFARAVAARYNIRLTRVVAADIDRDGDIDVLGATERGLFVWVNDGTGQLTSQSPRPTLPGVLWDQPSDTWDPGRRTDQSTIQNDPPTPRVSSARAHAPPIGRVVHAIPPTSIPASDFARGPSVPRAPPAISQR